MLIKRVLFVCVENSNRSQMAEAFARMHGRGRTEAASAGSKPSGRVNPKAVEVEYEEGVISQHPIGGMEATPSGLLFHLGTKHSACLAPEKYKVGDTGCCCPRAYDRHAHGPRRRLSVGR